MSSVSLFMVTLVVPEMNAAIAHYTADWGFAVFRDDHHVSGHRWVEIAAGGGARIRLVEASNDDQRAVIGKQAGGRVAFFLNSMNFDADVSRLVANGITLLEPVRCEDYGRIVVLADKYGNRWDLIETQDKQQQ